MSCGCFSLALLVLLISVRGLVTARQLLSPAARRANGTITKKRWSTSRGIPIYGASYFFDAVRDDDSRCRVEGYAGDIPPDVYHRLTEGGDAQVVYLPKAPEKNLLLCQ